MLQSYRPRHKLLLPDSLDDYLPHLEGVIRGKLLPMLTPRFWQDLTTVYSAKDLCTWLKGLDLDPALRAESMQYVLGAALYLRSDQHRLLRLSTICRVLDDMAGTRTKRKHLTYILSRLRLRGKPRQVAFKKAPLTQRPIFIPVPTMARITRRLAAQGMDAESIARCLNFLKKELNDTREMITPYILSEPLQGARDLVGHERLRLAYRAGHSAWLRTKLTL